MIFKSELKTNLTTIFLDFLWMRNNKAELVERIPCHNKTRETNYLHKFYDHYEQNLGSQFCNLIYVRFSYFIFQLVLIQRNVHPPNRFVRTRAYTFAEDSTCSRPKTKWRNIFQGQKVCNLILIWISRKVLFAFPVCSIQKGLNKIN